MVALLVCKVTQVDVGCENGGDDDDVDAVDLGLSQAVCTWRE